MKFFAPKFQIQNLLALLVWGAPFSWTGHQQVFEPVADTFVAENYPFANYGNWTTLQVRTAVGQGRHTWLKFHVDGVQGRVDAVSLRVKTNSALTEVTLWKVDDTSWTETGLVWQNQNYVGATPIASQQGLAAGTELLFDLSGHVTGNGFYTLVLTTNDDFFRSFFSRESDHGPRLEITANRAPIAIDDTADTAAGIPVVVNVTQNDFDLDGDPVTLLPETSQPWPTPAACHCTLERINGSQLRYTPDVDFPGTEASFTYMIGDGLGLRDVGNVTISVDNGVFPLIDVAADDGGGLGPFPATEAGAPVTRSYTISNAGTTELVIHNPQTIVDSADFVLDQPPPGQIPAGGSGSFAIRLMAQQVGEARGSVAISNNTSGANPFTFDLWATVNPSSQLPNCGPGDMVATLHSVLQGGPSTCNWAKQVQKDFGPWFNGSSNNLPVVAAAIALVVDPVNSEWNMFQWWDTYLNAELGETNPTGALGFYGGNELTSGNYQAYNIAAVLAVHYWAQEIGDGDLKILARRWLRVTWALHALAAGSGPAKTFHDRGNLFPGQVNSSGQFFYNGPYVALAGARFNKAHWNGVARGTFFSKAVAWPITKFNREPDDQRLLRQFLEGDWGGTDYSLYGLSGDEPKDLRKLITDGTVPGFLEDMIGSIKTIRKLHFMGWPGVRATLMEGNPNGNTVPTYGIAYFTQPNLAGGMEAHFLYPWRYGRDRASGGEGWGIAVVGNPLIRASNEPGNAAHPEDCSEIRLPSGPPQFHVTLTRTGPKINGEPSQPRQCPGSGDLISDL